MESRFWYCTDSFRLMWNRWGLFLSEKFCNYFADNVQEILFKEAGLKPSRKVSLSVFPPDNNLPMYEPGPVSRINTAISILPYFTGNISFCWRSKSGVIVHSYDENFDETELECWIEGIDAKSYWEELTKVSINHPLKMKNLPYDFVVDGIGTHLGLYITVQDRSKAQEIINQLAEEVEKHNRKSEANDRADGVVHNCKGEIKDKNIVFRIDVGSAGVIFIKKLLRRLAKYPDVTKVNVDF